MVHASSHKGSWLNENENVAKLNIVFVGNPYDIEIMDYLNPLREDNSKKLLK